MSTAWLWGLRAYVIAIGVALLPAWLLLLSGETLRGRLAGLVPVLLAALLPLALWAWQTRRRRWLPAAVAGLAALSLGVMLARTPDGQPAPSARVRSVYLGGGTFDRWSIANVVPEIDQLELGSYLVAPVDPFIDWEQAGRLRGMVLAQYRAMEAQPEFHALGSVMGAAYADRDVGHVYEYTPEPRDKERLPVLLFLHGSAGNFKAYFYLLQKLAEANRMILLCPSFGFGNWQRPGGMEAVDRAYRHAIEELGGDGDRVFLAALSNGGRGATRSWAAHPDRYAGVVLVSAVLESEPIASVGQGGFRGTPALVLHGAVDRRIPLVYIEQAVSELRARDADVTLRVWPQEDHFLLFSRDEEVRKAIGDWMRGSRAGKRVP